MTLHLLEYIAVKSNGTAAATASAAVCVLIGAVKHHPTAVKVPVSKAFTKVRVHKLVKDGASLHAEVARDDGVKFIRQRAAFGKVGKEGKIGRASCRERVYWPV